MKGILLFRYESVYKNDGKFSSYYLFAPDSCPFLYYTTNCMKYQQESDQFLTYTHSDHISCDFRSLSLGRYALFFA